MPKPLVEIVALDAACLPPDDLIFGRTPALQEIRERALKLANSQVPLLIRGESGTGKEALAGFMHMNSPWKSGVFVKVHCPGIPESLVESELFGYEESGATAAGPELQADADVGGTLLLDEVSELSAGAQVKFLRALQEGQAVRIDLSQEKVLRARLISTTNHALEPEMRRDRFRPDLFYRLSVATLRLPPLRERREDIQALTEYFLNIYSRKNGRSVPPLSNYAMGLLQDNPWPGNIRELENLINRYCILGSEDVITDALLGGEAEAAPDSSAQEPAFSLRRIARNAARGAERKALLQVLNANQGNRKKTARVLNISYRSLLYKIRDAGIPRKNAHERPAEEPGLMSGSSLPGTGNDPATH